MPKKHNQPRELMPTDENGFAILPEKIPGYVAALDTALIPPEHRAAVEAHLEEHPEDERLAPRALMLRMGILKRAYVVHYEERPGGPKFSSKKSRLVDDPGEVFIP